MALLALIHYAPLMNPGELRSLAKELAQMFLIDKLGHRVYRLYARDNDGSVTQWAITPYLFCGICKKVYHQAEIFKGDYRVMSVADDKPITWLRALLDNIRYGQRKSNPAPKKAEPARKNKPKKSFRF